MSGGATIYIPAGTFIAPVTMNVYEYASASAPATSTAFGVLFMPYAYIIDAGGLEPQAGSSVTIALPYNLSDIPSGYTEVDLTLAYYDGTSWVTVPSTVNTVNHTVTAVVDHFSWWAVVLRLYPATPTPTPYKFNASPIVFPNPSDGKPVKVVPPITSVSDVKVQVLTLSFREVYEQTFLIVQPGTSLTIPSADQWNKPLANGLYYVVVTTPHDRYLGKWLILR
jgi:hypothetical protein